MAFSMISTYATSITSQPGWRHDLAEALFGETGPNAFANNLRCVAIYQAWLR